MKFISRERLKCLEGNSLNCVSNGGYWLKAFCVTYIVGTHMHSGGRWLITEMISAPWESNQARLHHSTHIFRSATSKYLGQNRVCSQICQKKMSYKSLTVKSRKTGKFSRLISNLLHLLKKNIYICIHIYKIAEVCQYALQWGIPCFVYSLNL